MKIEAGYLLENAAKRYKNNIAIITEDKSYTYEYVHHQSKLLASSLKKLGIKTGDKVAVWLANGLEVVTSFFALERLGAVRVPIDIHESITQAKKILNATQTRAVICSNNKVIKLLDEELDFLITVGGEQSEKNTFVFQELIDSSNIEDIVTEVDDALPLQEYVRMVTDNQPLSVVHTHRNWISNIKLNIILYLGGYYGARLGEEDIFLNVQQLMHGTSIVGFYPLHLLGVPIVMQKDFKAENVLNAFEKHQVTSTFMVPGMIERIQKIYSPREHDISSIRRILYGGAPFKKESLFSAIKTFPNSLIQLYGRFDAVWPITILNSEDHNAILTFDEKLVSSCGHPIPFIEFKLVNKDDENISKSGFGEILVRGNTVIPDALGENDWCRTTDLAYQDEDGYLYIKGRTDSMINTGSYHVYPAEIEEVLSSHSIVDRVKVFGVPDEKWGEAIKANIVISQKVTNENNLVEELQQYCKQRLASHKAPKIIEFVSWLEK